MPSHFYARLRDLPALTAENTLPPEIVYVTGCRDYKQFCCTVRAMIDPGRFCPFCQKELARRERTPTFEYGGWMLLENEFPNRDADKMWLIVPITHRVVADLTDDDWIAIGRNFNYARNELGLQSGGFVMRHGDPNYHVGTVPHMHANIIVPKPGTAFGAVLAKSTEMIEEDLLRSRGFVDQIEERGGETWLVSAEGVRETQPVLG